MIERFSSRRARLGGFLSEHLRGARRYDRIAGYFSSSIVEVAGEALETMAPGAVARVVCNSELAPLDVATARAAKRAQYREWCASLPDDLTPAMRARLERLYCFLRDGRLRVRVLPDNSFGLVHGKAGVIERENGAALAFIGSVNESRRAWTLNYEMLWSDGSAEGVAWVQEEFEALWSSPAAFDLADAVVQDIERQTHRTVIPSVAEWQESRAPDPAAPVVELPVYRRENGLWAHQKAFIKRAFEEHTRGGARLILADQVGLGKTVQLALAAKLMALWGRDPVLILVPRPLLKQWQEELWRLLSLPSAIWTDNRWVDEHGIAYPRLGLDGLGKCPRRVGIVSTGMIVQSAEATDQLMRRSYACIILDEAHRARRRNLGAGHANKDEKPEPNNLLRFLHAIALRTRSLLLATATPVQLDPIEAWDLLDVLGRGHDEVIGTSFSAWRTSARTGLALVTGRHEPPPEPADTWNWMRDPLPSESEGRDWGQIRARLHLTPRDVWAKAGDFDRLGAPDRARVGRLARTFFGDANPYIRHIVRRTREFLEEEIDPSTGEPFLPPVHVRLFGEREDEAINLPPYLKDAYAWAEAFCDILGKRPGLNSGFLKTILLRRAGSSLEAGLQTARKMLGIEAPIDEDEDEDEDDTDTPAPTSALYPLTVPEREALEKFVDLLAGRVADDPKARAVEQILLAGTEGTLPWLEQGCIIFSQYYDSVRWLGGWLSRRLPEESIGVYAGADRSAVIQAGVFTRVSRDAIKERVQRGEMRLLLGTDAASEGLNLQRLGTLINLDLPWNPTRLEQRKGRIQRIGQTRAEVFVYNMRYRGSVEDRVHALLSDRLQAIRDLFGQLPDTLEDVWVRVAQRDEQKALEIINELPREHPFELRNDHIDPIDWESCGRVLDSASQLDTLRQGW
jgi:superfamily II DNA or RNA helicase